MSVICSLAAPITNSGPISKQSKPQDCCVVHTFWLRCVRGLIGLEFYTRDVNQSKKATKDLAPLLSQMFPGVGRRMLLQDSWLEKVSCHSVRDGPAVDSVDDQSHDHGLAKEE